MRIDYVSFDGQIFARKEDCEKYEAEHANLADTVYREYKDGNLIFFDSLLDELGIGEEETDITETLNNFYNNFFRYVHFIYCSNATALSALVSLIWMEGHKNMTHGLVWYHDKDMYRKDEFGQWYSRERELDKIRAIYPK